jgi:hypothetical protein
MIPISEVSADNPNQDSITMVNNFFSVRVVI